MRDYARSKRDELSLLTACKRDVGAKSASFLGSCSSVQRAMLRSVAVYSYSRTDCSETVHISAAASHDGAGWVARRRQAPGAAHSSVREGSGACGSGEASLCCSSSVQHPRHPQRERAVVGPPKGQEDVAEHVGHTLLGPTEVIHSKR